MTKPEAAVRLPSTTASFRAYDVVFEVCALSRVLERLGALLTWAERLPEATAAERRYEVAACEGGLFSLKVDGCPSGDSALRDTILDRLESDARLMVADRNPLRIFIHAGVVGWKDRAIVLPGRSFAGKSTLVAALIEQGASYYSDEYAVCDDEGRVHPFRKPLDLRAEGQTAQTRVDAAALGATVGESPLAVGVVLCSGYRAGASFRPRRMTAGEGVLALFDNTVCARRRPERALEVLQRVVADAAILRGERGDAREAARQLLAEDHPLIFRH